MNLTLNTKKSTSIQRYYRCDASTVNELCQFNDQWGRGESDYPTARQYLADELGVNMDPLQKVMEPYAHCDPVVNIFTQPDESRRAGQARVRLAFAPLVLRKDGKFGYLTPDKFPVKGNFNYHFEITCSLVFDGRLADKHQDGVVRSKLLADSREAEDDEVCRQTAAWSEVLTGLRYAQTDRRDPPVLFAYCRDFYSRDMIGERLYLTLSSELDLPWMVDNSRGLLEQLAEDPNFQKLVRMKRAILDAIDMRSASTRSDKVKPLAVLEESATAYARLFTEDFFAEAVTSKTAVVHAAVKSLHETLDTQIQAAEAECSQEIFKFLKRENPTLTTFLQYV